MPIPFDQIHADLKAKKLTRINQLFEYAPLLEWKREIGLRKGVLERLIEDPKKYARRYVLKISIATGIKDTTIERLIQEQKKYNWAMKREGGQTEGHQGPQPEEQL